jgi:ABC-type branched-subunit amino acid transport system ATPase component
VIETDELTKLYNGQIAVDHPSFSVEEGEIYGLLGPNGAGKATTLLMFLGLSEPTSRNGGVLSFTSPMKLYTDVTASIVGPMRRTLRPFIVQMGIIKQWSMSRFSGPLPLVQSFLMVVLYIIYLVAITIICFAIFYIVFIRQEIHSI